MKVVMISGFLNYHLNPLCQELAKACDFSFIATQKEVSSNKNRVTEDYLINYYEEDNQPIAEKLIAECDVAIFGGSAQRQLELRKKTGKLSFIYTERPFKLGRWRRYIPSTRRQLEKSFIQNGDNVYALCAGSYVASDLKLLGFDTAKCFSFGYFPKLEVSKSNVNLKSDCVQLLYVGQFLRLKRVHDIINCCWILKKKGYRYHLKIVGAGPVRDSLMRKIQYYGLLDDIELIDYAPHETVMKLMNESNILFMPSNQREGWGAVVNEALGNGCVVIGSHTCGAVPCLIKDGENGYVYCMGNVREMVNKTIMYLENNNKGSMHLAAYKTIMELWNERIAALRLLEVSQSILSGEAPVTYVGGPMSKAVLL